MMDAWGEVMMERRKKKRRKSDREPFNTSLDPVLINMLQALSEETGIPMNRLIENALREKYEEYLR
jgi:ribosomal protein S8E